MNTNTTGNPHKWIAVQSMGSKCFSIGDTVTLHNNTLVKYEVASIYRELQGSVVVRMARVNPRDDDHVNDIQTPAHVKLVIPDYDYLVEAD
jgi:hypothetical protein